MPSVGDELFVSQAGLRLMEFLTVGAGAATTTNSNSTATITCPGEE